VFFISACSRLLFGRRILPSRSNFYHSCKELVVRKPSLNLLPLDLVFGCTFHVKHASSLFFSPASAVLEALVQILTVLLESKMVNLLEMQLCSLPRNIVFNGKLKSRLKAWIKVEISLGMFPLKIDHKVYLHYLTHNCYYKMALVR
jgi:hypothetical protein